MQDFNIIYFIINTESESEELTNRDHINIICER